MTHETRERVKRQYSRSGREYDEVRLVNPRGRMLSEYDVRLFLDMLPSLDTETKILEVGAGTGRFTMPMLDRGYQIIATDINETMLEELRAKVEEAGKTDQCHVQIEDIFQLSFPDETFDFVFSLHVIPRLQSLEDQRDAINEVARTIKPGGRFLFNYRNKRSLLYGPFLRGHGTTPAEIDRILDGAGMRIVTQRGKMLLNRTLLNKLPPFVSRMLAGCDAKLTTSLTSRAWDVFVLTEKRS